ncbi:MAG TPA: hypothetical protein VGO50_04490 [Pyrinomonadaceae bacterium]|jgi:hypothetical protein|nr:hypothetical protein [Pyrinomonadaceae bacterium]
MKKHELQDERLDEAGRKLLEIGRIQDSELERIISAPHLFSAIKTRVKAEEAKPAARFDWRTVFSFLAQPNAAAAFAALLIAVFAFGGFYLYSRQAAPPTGVATNISQPKKPEHVVQASLPGDSGPSQAVADDADDETPAQPKTAIYRPAYKTEPSTARVSYRKKAGAREAVHYESDGEFYPLTFTGGSNEIAPGAQIVRVELPRSSLFSMGVDLPDDNRTGTVKADLLISSDGVARGFRLVK